MNLAGRLATGALLLPGALTVYLSFNAGGFFPNTVAFAALMLAAVLALRIALAESPFDGFSPRLAIAAGGLALLALWTLLSGRWSDAPGRALVEFDRVLLYLLALVLFGSLPRTPENVRWMLRGLALGIAAVCVTALATRVLPDVFPTAETIANNRLSYPLTYWNALGVLAAVGIILCFHLAGSKSEPPAVRVLGAAAVPPIATTLFFTFSRGAIVAGIVGLVIYMAVGRPRALLSALLATIPMAAIAVVIAYDADLLASLTPATSKAVHQGHRVALAVGACTIGAGILRGLLLLLDSRLKRPRLVKLPRYVLASAAAAAVIAAVAIALALNVPNRVGDQYDRFVRGAPPGNVGDLRTRLTDPSNNGRLDHWDVALDAFPGQPLDGTGAGTYQNTWAMHRPNTGTVLDAHSLYVETLSELGVVGVGLLAITLLVMLVTVAARTRGRHPTLYAALLGAIVIWMLHAGADWDWEMPAVTLWVFALGGAALAHSARQRRPRSLNAVLRIAAVVGCFAIAIVPGLLLVSQTRLDDSADAFERGDCASAVNDAGSAISALAVRPEPYEIRGFCRAQHGSPDQAVRDFEMAVDRDPDSWTYHYDLALARAAAGLDPRPEAAKALRLDPLSVEARYASKRLRSGGPNRWRREARALLRGASPFYLSTR